MSEHHYTIPKAQDSWRCPRCHRTWVRMLDPERVVSADYGALAVGHAGAQGEFSCCAKYTFTWTQGQEEGEGHAAGAD